MPEIGKGRITPGTGDVSYSNTGVVSSTSPTNAGTTSNDLNDLRARLSSAEERISRIVQDVGLFSQALSGFEALLVTTTNDGASIEDVLHNFSAVASSVESLSVNVGEVSAQLAALVIPQPAEGASQEELDALTTRVDSYEEIVNTATAQVSILTAELAAAVEQLETFASQTGLDAVAQSVVTKANKNTKILTGGLIASSGPNDLSADRTMIVPKASADEVDAGIVDHKAVTPASLTNLLQSIRNISSPIGIGTTNVLNTRSWIPGIMGDQGKFKQLVTAATAQNFVTLRMGPFGKVEPVWTSKTLSAATTATNDVNGGFSYAIDYCAEGYNPKHSYRFTVWAYQSDNSGSLTFGCDTSVSYLNNSAPSTPDFLHNVQLPELNKWFLLVGLVYGHTYTGAAEQISGIYDPATGIKVTDGEDFKAKANSAEQQFRVFRSNANVSASTVLFARPRIDIITGEEPTVNEILGWVVSDIMDGQIDLGLLATASPQDVTDMTATDKAVTPASLSGLPKASPADVLGRTNNNKFVTPASLAGLTADLPDSRLATVLDVEQRTDPNKIVTAASLQGLNLPTSITKASVQQTNARVSNDVFVTPASLANFINYDLATPSDVASGTSSTKLVTPYSLQALELTSNADQRRRDGSAINAVVIAQDGTAIDHVLNSDGSADLSFEWAWGGDQTKIDGFEVHIHVGDTSDPYVFGSDANETVSISPAQNRAIMLYGIAADRYYSFSVTVFRRVDFDINPSGFVRSTTVVPPLSAENPYRPVANVAFNGNITGTIDGMQASTVQTGITNFNTRNDRDGSAIPAPSIASDGSAIDHTVNTDGSVDLSFEWTWTGSEASIDGFAILFSVADSPAPYSFDGSRPEFTLLVPANKRAFIQQGIAADRYYSFAVRAYRVVDGDIDADGMIYSPLAMCTDAAENPYHPENEVAFSGNILGTINGLLVSVVTEAVSNFNTRNDRDGSPIVNPVVKTDGTAVDHVLNTDGSADVSFEWMWSGDEATIDGFTVLVHIGATATPYTFNDANQEIALNVPANKRSFIMPGVAADKFYSFAIRAYRLVDSDINDNNIIASATVKNVTEDPYRPSSEVAFNGSIAGTLTNLTAASIVEGLENFNGRNDRNGLPIVEPVITNDGTAIDHVLNTDGSANLSFEWAWSGNEEDIDGFIIYQSVSGSSAPHTFNTPANEFQIYVEANKRAVIVPGVAADQYYTFGVRAYRFVDNDVDPSGCIKTAIIVPSHVDENPYRPETNVAFAGDVIGTIANRSVATIVDSSDNFNARNDRIGTPIIDPVVASNETAVDHVLNNDSSCDISFEWSWAGDESEIDGFQVVYYAAPASGVSPPFYAFDNPSIEIVVSVPANKRSIFLLGVAADKYYSFGVRAYRIVDPDINSSGVIFSGLITTTHLNECPYRPTANLAFVGELTGTVDGESQAFVANAARNFNTRNDRNATPPVAPTIASDGSAVDHVQNTDGSVDISFEWSFSGIENDIDGFIIYRDVSTTSTTNTFTAPASEMANYVPANKRSLILPGVPADKYYSFGVRSYRAVDNDVAAAGFLQSAIITPSAAGEKPYRPSANVAFAGNITGTINNLAVSTITSSVANFNARNDRLATAVAVPVVASDGTAIDHTVNTDGSVDLSFEWEWSGNQNDIDGFTIYVSSSSSSATYAFGSSAPNEVAVNVPAEKRAHIIYGVPANHYYTIGVRAYRIVDPDVNSSGYITSAIVKSTRGSENPYLPTTNVAFAGDITGTVNSVAVATLTTAVANFNNRNDRLATAIVQPSFASDGTAVDHVVNTDGSADLSVQWTWTGSEADIDGFIFYYRAATTAAPYTFGSAVEVIETLPANKRAIVLPSLAADKYYTFGVRAYRIVDPDVSAGGIIQTSIVSPSTIAGEHPYRPAANIAFGGDIYGTINGIQVATITDATQNFNNRNDRNVGSISAPTLVTDGTCVEHVRNTDGTVNISFKWAWSGNNVDIDGFIITTHVDTVSTPYAFNNSAVESVNFVTAAKREAWVYGVPANRYYSFAVRAYRVVDPDVNSSGYIYSPQVAPTRPDENPYLPMTSIIVGDGTTVTLDQLIDAVSTAQTAYTSSTTLTTQFAEYSNDSLITALERLLIRREIASATAERSELRALADTFAVTTEKTAEQTAWDNLLAVLTGMSPSYTSTLAESSIINRVDFNSKTTAWKTAFQDLANRIASLASTMAIWNNVTGAGRPEDNATANPQTAYEYFPTGFQKTGGVDGNWDSQVYSQTGYSTDFTLRFKVDRDPGRNREIIIGLNTAPSTNNSYQDMNFGFHLYQEDKIRAATWTGITPNWLGAEALLSYDSVCEIQRVGTSLRFYVDGVLIGSGTAPANTVFYVDSSLRNTGRLIYFLTVFGAGITKQPLFTSVNCSLTMATDGQGNFDGQNQWTLMNGQWKLTSNESRTTFGPFYPAKFKKIVTDSLWSGSCYSANDDGAPRLFPIGSKLYFRVPDTSGTENDTWGQFMIGFNSDPTGSETFSDLDAAAHLSNATTIRKYLDGNDMGVTATVLDGEWLYFEIGVTNVTLHRENGTVVFTFANKGGQPLGVDSSFYGHNSYVDGVSVVKPNGQTVAVYYKIKESSGGGKMIIDTQGAGEGTTWNYAGKARILRAGLWEIAATTHDVVVMDRAPTGADVSYQNGDIWYYNDPSADIFRQYLFDGNTSTWADLGQSYTTFRQAADPTTNVGVTVQNGDMWVQTSTGYVYLRDSGTWQVIATLGAPAGTYVAGVLAETVRDNAANGLQLAADIVNDNLLSRDEKPAVIIEWGRIQSEYTSLYNQSATMNVATPRTTFNNAYTALNTYLTVTLNQTDLEWNNTSVSTPIVAATYRAKFTDYYTAAAALSAAMDASAAATATWATVIGVGRPSDYATRNEYRGDWAGNTAYNSGDIVGYLGNGYICTTVHTSSAGSPPPNGNFSLFVQKGAAALVGVLTNGAHTIPADSSGNVNSPDLAAAGGTFQLYDGTALVTSGITYSVVSQSGVSISINSSGVYSVSAVSADSGYATIRANYNGVDVDKIYSIAKARAGTSVKSLYLTSDRQAIYYDNSGNLAPNQTTTFTAALQFVSAGSSVTWTAKRLDGTALSIVGLLTITGTQNTIATMTASAFATGIGSTNGVIITATTTDGLTYSDTMSVIKLQDGADGTSPINIILSNENHTVATASDGSGGDFSLANGTITVYSGTTDVTALATFGTVTATGCTGTVNTSINTPVASQPKGFYRVTALSADTATLLIPVTYGGNTVNKIFTVGRAKGGIAAKVISLNASRSTVAFDAAEVVKANQTSSFTATLVNSTATVHWKIYKVDGTTLIIEGDTGATNLTTAGFTFSGNTLAFTETFFASFCTTNSTTGMVIEASFNDNGVTGADRESVVKITDGVAGQDAISLTTFLTTDPASVDLQANHAKKVSNVSSVGVYSQERYAGGAFASARLQNAGMMMGLTAADPASSSSFTDITYAIHAQLGGTYQIYEEGAIILTSGVACASGQIMSVTYDNYAISYAINGTVIHSHAVASNQVLYFDSSFLSLNAELDSMAFGPMGSRGPQGLQGATGATGATGAAGAQGASLYTWVAYANDSSGSSGFTIGANTGQTHIGIANNQASSTESTNPNDYQWSLIKGADGVPGTPGANGQPTYTWFAYASSADGSVNFTNGAPSAGHTYVGIAANKATPTESSVASDYTWSLMTGADGAGTVTFTKTAGVTYVPATMSLSCVSSAGWGFEGFYSNQRFVGGCNLTFNTPNTYGTNEQFMVGINEDASSHNTFTDIDYCFYLVHNVNVNGGTYEIYTYESGVGTYIGTWSGLYTFSIRYDGSIVSYYIDSTLARQVAAGPNRAFSVDGAFAVAGSISNLSFTAAGATGAPGATGAAGATGATGANGANGANGRDAMVFYQTTQPSSGYQTGDTWYNPNNKSWYRFNGSAWVQLLGNVAAFDQIGAAQIAAGSITADRMNVTSLSSVSATIGTLRTASSGARVEIVDNQIRVYDASNVLRVRLGIW